MGVAEQTPKTLCLVLGDQLTETLASLQVIDRNRDTILMAEVREEATYVKHHQKKIALLFSAMRHFAWQLSQQGFQVNYRKYDAPANKGSLFLEVANLVLNKGFDRVVVVEPGEYRLLTEVQSWQQKLGVPVDILEDHRFLCSKAEFATWATGRKQLRMEYFYRKMRQQHNVLMDKAKPIGGKWNYDNENRKKLPNDLPIPNLPVFEPDNITEEVLTLVASEFSHHFGKLYPFNFAVTRHQALAVLHQFIAERLKLFGDFQDAMKTGEDGLFHSHISFYLNCGLLTPKEVIDAAEHAFQDNQVPLNAVEGFIRQILGWREYVRGFYWHHMPEHKTLNYLQAKGRLPSFYWGEDTDMHCISEAVRNTSENAYAHHIQRLMVLGNFALLAGVHPDAVNEWYLLVYADAYEWVELPNVSGMVLFADGGILASKPYAASGAYIHKMSDHCQHCRYNVKDKLGENACPFNYLYWNFLINHQEKFRKNPRMAMIYRNLDNKSSTDVHQIKMQSADFLNKIGVTQD